MDSKVMFQLSYGLYVLTVKNGEKKNGCIINTVMQQTSEPNCISVTVNKNNLTENMLEATGTFNVSIIDENGTFSLIQNFGFQSGRDKDKFVDFSDYKESANGIPYITKGCNAYLSGKVIRQEDLGSHMMFIAEVTDGELLEDTPTMTYAYYHANVKPKATKTESTGKVWVCRICGYRYEDAKEKIPFEELPADWVCPLCMHGKADFELE